MSKAITRIVSKMGSVQAGFTLVELLVVVAIIVALSAVMVPSVANFADKGDTGAQNAELENLQSAVDSFMADTSVTSVTPLSALGDTSTGDFSASGTLDLTGYLRETTTTYFYCWDATGLVLSQDTAAAADCTNAGDGAK